MAAASGCHGAQRARCRAIKSCEIGSSANRRVGQAAGISGALFSLLAIATFARMMIVWTELNKAPTFATIQPWLPVVAWMLAAGLLLVIALRRGDGGALQRV